MDLFEHTLVRDGVLKAEAIKPSDFWEGYQP